jgi:CheY-like chemotaxis protein
VVTDSRMYVRNLKVTPAADRIALPTTSQFTALLLEGSVGVNHPILAGSEVNEVMSRAKATILCIDDHWSGLIGRKMLLEESGYNVLEATGWDEGLKLFLAHHVDAVVLDYQMPGMRGDVVAAKMKHINSRVPIMLLSAYGPLPKRKLRSVDTFLSKSQPPEILLSTLRELLDSRKPFFSRWLDHWKNRNQGVIH